MKAYFYAAASFCLIWYLFTFLMELILLFVYDT